MYNVHIYIYIIKKHTSNWQIVIWCVNFDSSFLLILLNEHAAAAAFFVKRNLLDSMIFHYWLCLKIS